MPKIKVICEVCGKEVYRYTSGIKEHVFCSRSCAKEYTSKRMTDEVKENLRWSHMLKGDGKAYPKIHGRHAHRVMAEKILGRKLKPGEVVHHKDENKLNYSENNLEILKSQKEHAKLHHKEGRFK